MSDWDPEAYSRFRGLRLRPALDLLAQVGALPGGAIIDLGCGDGAVASALRQRFPERQLIGVDSSPSMLAKAREKQVYSSLAQAEIALWAPHEAPALIYSNAALQWLDRHDQLMPRLAGYLPPGGMLAVQMPGQDEAPSHRLLRDVAAGMFPDRFDFSGYEPWVRSPEYYWRLLSPLGAVNVWETRYVQRLEPSQDGHPVRRFTESTAMRRIVERLDPDQTDAFMQAYDQALVQPYPPLPDGAALMTFRRVFFVLQV